MSSNGHFTTRRGFVGTMGFGALGLYATWAAYGASPTPFASGTTSADPHAGHGAPTGHAGHEEPAIAEGHAPARMTPDEFRTRHAEFVATNTQPDGSVRPTPDAHDHAGHDHGSDDHGAHDHAAPPAAPPPAPTAAAQPAQPTASGPDTHAMHGAVPTPPVPTTPPAGAMPHDMSTHMQMMRDMHAGHGTAMPNGVMGTMPNGMGGAMPPMANMQMMQDMHAGHSMPGHDMSNMPDMMRTMHGDHAMPTPSAPTPAPVPAPEAAPAPQAPPPAASGHEGHTMNAAPPAPAPQPTPPAVSGHEGHAMQAPAASPAPAASTAAPVAPATGAPAHDHADGPIEVFVAAGRFAFEPADLRLETGRTYRFHMMSTDVAHGASIAFGKASRIVRLRPDTVTTLDLTFREAGRHLVYCTVYCGPGHDGMRASITVG